MAIAFDVVKRISSSNSNNKGVKSILLHAQMGLRHNVLLLCGEL